MYSAHRSLPPQKFVHPVILLILMVGNEEQKQKNTHTQCHCRHVEFNNSQYINSQLNKHDADTQVVSDKNHG
jgi:hypothetical protein